MLDFSVILYYIQYTPQGYIAVSYTHLDVYKRQGTDRNRKDSIFWNPGASQSRPK